jgi:hypothetical protein
VLWPAHQHKSANLNFNDTFVALILDMYSVSLTSFCYFFVSRLIIARSYLHRSVLPSSGILLQNDWLILVIRVLMQWMYILPFGLIVINAITSITNMPDEPASGQAGAAPAGAVPQRISGAGGGRRQ